MTHKDKQARYATILAWRQRHREAIARYNRAYNAKPDVQATRNAKARRKRQIAWDAAWRVEHTAQDMERQDMEHAA